MTVSTAGCSDVRMVWHNGQRGQLEGSEEWPTQVSAWSVGVEGEWYGITVSTTGCKRMSRNRHNCQHGWLEWSEDGPT